MKHAAFLTLILVGIFIGWRIASPEQRVRVWAVTRQYVIPALLIAAIVAVLFALFVINSPIQIL